MTTQIKIAMLLASVLLAFGYTKAIRYFAYQSGASDVRLDWNKENSRRDLITEQLESKNKKLTQENKDLTGRILQHLRLPKQLRLS